MGAKRDKVVKKRATKKSKRQGKFALGARALAKRQSSGPFAAEKKQPSGPSTPRRRKQGVSSTPPKARIILSEAQRQEEAEKRREKKRTDLRKEVLGATSQREWALAMAREAIAQGKINPSWLRRSAPPALEQPLDKVVSSEAEMSVGAP